MSEEWKELDNSLFSSCVNELKYDEMIYNDLFGSKSAMNSLEVSHIRLDSHMSQEGEYSVDELKSTGHLLLDEEATIDDIIAICSKFLTIQSLRLDGYTFQITILSSVYICKEYEIKNPLLKLMFKVFSVATYSIENFINNFGLYPASCWIHTDKYLKFIEKYEYSEVKQEVESYTDMPKILKDLATFELGLANFLDSVIKNDIPVLPELPTTTSESGIAKYFHYRNLSPSNPTPKSLETTVEEAHKTFKRLIEEINEAKKIFTSNEFIIKDIFTKVIEWNSSSQKIALTRFVALGLIILPLFPNPEDSFSEHLHKELAIFHCHINFFNSKGYPEFAKKSYNAFFHILRYLILPIPTAQAYFDSHGCQYWCYIQSLGFDLQKSSTPDRILPKCQSPEFQKCASIHFPLWSTRIASLLLENCIRWGFQCDLYSPRDYHIEYYLLEMASKTSQMAIVQERYLNAIYKAKSLDVRKKSRMIMTSDIAKVIEQPSAEEILVNAKSELFTAYFNSFCIFKKWKNIDINPGQYFNERGIFEMRQKVATQMMHFATKTYEEFESSVNIENGENKDIKLEAIDHFNKAKEYLMQFIKMTQTKTPESTEIMRAILMNVMFFQKLKENDKVKIVFNDSYKFYPRFEIVNP